LTKQLHAIATTTAVSASALARIVVREVIRHHGIPATLLSDRDPRFTAHLWRNIWETFQTKLLMSTSFHPQTDGQTERDNRTLEDMLRAYICSLQDDWEEYLPLVEIAYNSSVQASTGHAPYYLSTGREFPTFLSRAMEKISDSPSEAAQVMFRKWHNALEQAKLHMKAAQERQAKWANEYRRDLQYAVGTQVLLSTENLRSTILVGAPKFLPKFMGPYTITRVISPTAYELQLPSTFRIHPVFHIHLLKPYHDGRRFLPTRITEAPAEPELVEGDDNVHWEVESILRKRTLGRTVQYLVKWKGFNMEENTWEPLENLERADEAIQDFEMRRQVAPRSVRAAIPSSRRRTRQ